MTIYYIEYKNSIKIFSENATLEIEESKIDLFCKMLKRKIGNKKINFKNIVEV